MQCKRWKVNEMVIFSLFFVSGLEFERWLKECGPPLCEPDLSAGGMLTGPVQHLCELWGMESPDRGAIANFDLSTWSTFQTVLFLDRLLDRSPLPQGEHFLVTCGHVLFVRFLFFFGEHRVAVVRVLIYTHSLFFWLCRSDESPIELLLGYAGRHECRGADTLAAGRSEKQLLSWPASYSQFPAQTCEYISHKAFSLWFCLGCLGINSTDVDSSSVLSQWWRFCSHLP